MPRHRLETEGPFGLPMKDKQAKALETLLKDVPKNDAAFAPRRLSSTKGLSELSAEARTDVSWITVETPDHAGDLIIASGMDDSIYQLNPIVTLNHHYDRPPVGRSVWRRGVKEGPLAGVKAKTLYPPRPQTWTNDDWPADQAFELVKAGLLRGKSIGFLPLQLRSPSAAEIEQDPQLRGVRHVISRWLLLEYACCYLPMQPFALVENVAKSLSPALMAALELAGAGPREKLEKVISDMPMSPDCSFTSWPDLLRALTAQLASQDFSEIMTQSLQRTFQKLRGIV